jgi:transcription-repair coupling factor (superfamily II helicase)
VALAGDGARAVALARRLRGRFGALPEVAGWLALREAAPGALLWLKRPLAAGFATAEALVVAAGDVLSPRRAGAGPARLPLPEAFLAPGDAVIHLDHGVAALRGLDCVEGMDCLSLEFAGGARKLVPVDELDRIWRYGAAAEAVSLDRLGGGAWEKRRAEAEAALVDTADGLVELARARNARTAPVLRAPRGAFARFCAGFPTRPRPTSRRREAALRDLARAADGPAGLRRCRLRQDGGGAAGSGGGGAGRRPGGGAGADHGAGPPAPGQLPAALRPARHRGGRAVAA